MAVHLFLLVFLVLELPSLREASSDQCSVTRCAKHGPIIRFPFWLEPERCGYTTNGGFELSCNKKKQTIMELPDSVQLTLEKIDYRSQIVHLRDPTRCLPRQLLNLNLSASSFQSLSGSEKGTLFNCSRPQQTGDKRWLVPCLSSRSYQVLTVSSIYPLLIYNLTSCQRIHDGNILTTSRRHRIWPLPVKGLQLTWSQPNCSKNEAQKGKMCSFQNNSKWQSEPACINMPKTTAQGTSNKLLITGIAFGILLLVATVMALVLVYTSHKTRKEDQVKIESFLEDYKALKPTRYSYADLKKITNHFAEKLGEGGYGIVYKGKLSSEIFVAVKVLNSSIGKGEEFINEVGTMAGIHHVNVVRLAGFCADGSRRALVYDFLPNSLDKFIFTEDQSSNTLGLEKLQDIALAIARGIEYLHQGCDQRILHFDIKPHNILLDHNLYPKIADFGLAKLCSKEQSIVSMTAVRGTMGYIAPEVFSRNFGNVSYKSDVYSFGMMSLEMVGGRKNIDVTVQNTSQAYFPEWVYNRLRKGEELGMNIDEEGHGQIARKLTVVGLWCIQWDPVDRPSMKDVVQMLEGKGDTLTVPPNPFGSMVQMNGSAKALRSF